MSWALSPDTKHPRVITSLPVIGALLGHTRVETTRRYAHLADDPIREASERIARAGLALACTLFALAVPRSERVAAPCSAPRDFAASHGRTDAVRCDGRGPRLRGPARRLFGLPIDPNAADALTLTTLPGIGPVRARAIIAARERRPFRSVADLVRAKGVGPRNLERVAPLLAVAHTRGDEAVPADRRHAGGEGSG